MMRIFYDGDCYFCSRYAELMKLKSIVGDVELKSLRDHPEEAKRFEAEGLNINNGFVVEHDGRTYFGADAFAHLTQLLAPKSFVRKLMPGGSGMGWWSSLTYRLLVVGRYGLLLAQGLPLINVNSTRAEGTLGERSFAQRGARLGVLLIALTLIVQAAVLQLYPVRSWLLFVVFIVGFWQLFTTRWSLSRVEEAFKKGPPTLLLLWLGLALSIIYQFDWISVRRIAFFGCALPLVGVAIDWALGKRRESDARLSIWIPAAVLVIVSFPGLYLAPFYGGIGGWTTKVQRDKPFNKAVIVMTNRKGEDVIFNHAFLEPMSMEGRLRRAWKHHDYSDEAFLRFCHDTYRRLYPKITDEHLPYQSRLGRLAYPTHNLSRNNAADYSSAFAPDEIVRIERRRLTIDWEGKVLATRVLTIVELNSQGGRSAPQPRG
ncbi:MAG: DCC1-like thiol-disulfide oxidoreductase family protein [Pseudomonadota bacterium]